MKAPPNSQALTHTVRLPDEAQAAALRLLEASRQTVNAIVVQMWPQLDDFKDGHAQAWKQLDGMTTSPDPHGDRQWRCEAETAGRILRAQAERKGWFEQVVPILAQNLILPATGKKPARKDHKAIMRLAQELRSTAGDDAERLMNLVNVAEQACNFYLKHDRFPASYEEMQAVPVLAVGMLTYAADDGFENGQCYRLQIQPDQQRVLFAFRGPDERGQWEACGGRASSMRSRCTPKPLSSWRAARLSHRRCGR